MKANGLKVEYVKREKLIPYVNNARTHSESQVKQIAASIKEFGFTNPVLVDENNGIIAGHGRLEAAALLELDSIPTIKLKGLSDAQRRAYVIADNKLALNADWNLELLAIEIKTLQDSDFDSVLLGFSENELELILKGWDSDINLEGGQTGDAESFVLRVCGPKDQEAHILELLESYFEDNGIQDITVKA